MKKLGLFIGAVAVPALASAQTVLTALDKVKQILNAVVPILITLAVIYFFWGLGLYILNAGSEDKKEEGRGIMIWGVVALFVMVSIWGLIGLIGGTFDIQSGGTINVPTVPTL